MSVNVAIIYYSTYGHNYQMAQVAEEAARAAGAEVRLRKVRETAPQDVIDQQEGWKKHQKETQDVEIVSLDDLDWADAIFFSAPTRYGALASQMRAFLDTTGPLWAKGKLANKLVTGMTSAQNPHGGQETTLQNLYTSMMHWGAIIVAPGYTDQSIFAAGGNPYGASITADGSPISDEKKTIIRHQANRLIDVAKRFKG